MTRARTPSDARSAPTTDAPTKVRLDVWLDVACVFKTRSEAQKACRGGKIDVNGTRAAPNRHVRPRDAITISRAFGRTQQLVIKALADQHVSKSLARTLYEDRTPQPSPEEIERRKIERMYRAAMTPAKAPDKRARRALRALKERQS